MAGEEAKPMSCGEPRWVGCLSWQELQEASDEDVARQLCMGNGDALEAIVNRYQKMVFAVAARIVKNRSEAEEVVQTVFFDIFRKVEQFDPARGTLKVWLLQFAYSRSINWLQYLQHRQFYSQVGIDDRVLNLTIASEGWPRMSTGEASRLIQQGMRLLSRKQQQTIGLMYFEGLTAEEAAIQTGETLGNVRHHYYRGLIKLRQVVNSKKMKRSSHQRSDVDS